MFKPDFAIADIKAITDEIGKKVAENGGKMDLLEDWGLKNLAYRIDKFEKAYYHIYSLYVDPLKVNNIMAFLNQKDGIVRNLLTVAND